MSSSKRVALLFVLLPLLGSIFSCLFFSARMRGTFTKWEMLGRPTSTPIKLIRMDYVESATREIYKFQYTERCTSNCWVKVETLPPALDTIDLLPIENCNQSFNIPSVHRFADSVIECKRWGTGILLTVQAIDQAGNVQMWRKGQDDFGDGLMVLMSPAIGAILGFVATILVFIVILFIGSVKSLMSRN